MEKKQILLFVMIMIWISLFAQTNKNPKILSNNQFHLQKSKVFKKQDDLNSKTSGSFYADNNIIFNNPQKSRGVPASPYPYSKKLPDGTEINLVMRGDGAVHWEETIDGYTVIKNNEGFYVYAAIDKYGDLKATNIIAGNPETRSISELEFLSAIDKHITFSQQQKQEKLDAYYANERDTKSSAKSFPTTGSRRLITILVEYPDETFTRTQSEFNDLFNSSNYTLEGATGSVKQYYSDNSFAQLDLTTDVVGPYTLPNNMAYYGGNDGSGDDMRPQEMISDAIALADADVDFSDYDNDGDGYVDGVYVVYAGYSEASGASEDAIWPHRWSLSWPGETYDGVTVYDYSCSNELYGYMGTSITGIGTVCHEFGHNCGLPDYYDTDYEGSGGEAFTLGSWDVMDGGAYNNYGRTPPFFNSFSRAITGWQIPTLLNSPESVTMLNTAENNVSYYYNTQTTNEYFLLENRQKISWDAYIPHHGMLVYHVDEDYIAANGNSFNTDPSFQGFDLVEADNTQTEGSRTGDPFPGNSSNTSFTDATVPSAQSYASQNTNKPITNIQEVGQVILFDFMGGAVSGVPVADFVADQTTIIVGTTVNFTDISTGVPDNYLWTFDGGDIPSSTDPNPSVTYNTPGTYDVTLYVSNTFGNDEITKTAYITVTGAPTTCEYIDNIGDTELNYYYSATGGYVTGVNDYDFTEFAEYYDFHINNLVEGVQLYVAKADVLSSNAVITMKIWDVVSGKPGNELYTEDFDISGFTPFTYNEVAFASTTVVPEEFFIGYEVYYTSPQDTFAVFQAENRGADPVLPTTAYIKYSGTWRDIDAIFTGDFNSSFAIAPYICPSPPTSDFTADVTSGCDNLSVQFTDMSSPNTDSWSWDFGDGNTSTEQSPVHFYDSPGTYTVTLTATNTLGSDDLEMTDYITIGASPSPVTVSGGGTQCGGTMTLTAGGGTGGTMYWQGTTSGGTSTTTASSSEEVSSSGTYYFRSVSPLGCWSDEGSATVTINDVPDPVTVSGGGTQCGGTMTLTASGGTGGTIYFQDMTSGGTSTVTASTSEVISTSGTYYFRAQSAEGCWGGEGSATVTINDIPDPVTVSGGGTQCGGTMELTASGGAGGTIYFQNTTSGGTGTATASSSGLISTSGTYYFRSQSAEGCWGDEGSAVVTINDVPDPVTVSGGGTQCGGTVILTANGGDGGTIYFQETISGGTSTANPSSSEEIATSGDYYFRSQSAEGCWGDEGSASVTIHTALTIEMSSTNETAPGANDGTATVTITSGTPDYLVDWSNAVGATISGTEHVITSLSGSTYCVTVTDDNSCTVEDCVIVNTDGAAPVAAINADVTEGCDNLTVSFYDNSSNEPTSWLWDFGDGSATSSDQDPVHEYTNPGVYTVTLEATNATGSDDITMTDYIVVGETPTIDYTVTPASGELVADGGISVSVSGGTEPYVVVWDHDAMETSLELADLLPGTYYLTVTEDNGCSDNETIIVNWVNYIKEITNELSIYPNPTDGQLNVVLDDTNIDNLTIINVLGEVVYQANPQTNEIRINVSSFAVGTYFIRLDFEDQSVVRKFVKQ